LKRREHWRLAIGDDVRVELAEKDAPRKTRFLPASALARMQSLISDFLKTGREFRGKVTHLIGMSQKHKTRIDVLDYLLHAIGISIRSGNQRVSDWFAAITFTTS